MLRVHLLLCIFFPLQMLTHRNSRRPSCHRSHLLHTPVTLLTPTSEVVLALLRNPRYCVYGASSQQDCSSTTGLEQAFNSASLRERSKFEQETLVNVAGGTARRSSYRPAAASSSSSGKPDELVVVTLLVATGCKVDLPSKINSLADLQAALQALGGLPQDQVLGVELLWTPQVRRCGMVSDVTWCLMCRALVARVFQGSYVLPGCGPLALQLVWVDEVVVRPVEALHLRTVEYA